MGSKERFGSTEESDSIEITFLQISYNYLGNFLVQNASYQAK
jgi:hypothetical protein